MPLPAPRFPSRWLLLAGLLSSACLAAVPGRLRVAADGHHLEHVDGSSFLYLADTAWTLMNRTTAEEADLYLANRAAKGFTVIQAVVLAPEGGVEKPNSNGDLPLVGGDLSRPNEAYFRHVDHVLARAGELGLTVGLLPSWGHYWKRKPKDGSAPLFTPDKTRAFGVYLGQRYKESALIWILGGDQDVSSPGERAVLDALAAGLREGDGGAHLIAYHPRGPGQSSDSLADAPWLDLHLSQTSHGGRDHDTGLFAEHDYALKPAKPTLDAESRYECMPVGFYFIEASRLDRFDDYDVRQAAYWSLFAGACGHTYGNNNVWQLWQPGREAALWANIPWKQSLDTPGAFQMGLLRRLFESHPFGNLVPDTNLVVDAPRNGGAKVRALMARDRSYAYVYSPRGEPFTVNKGLFPARRMREIWFDPRYGCSYVVHTTDSHSFQTFTPPTNGRGQDWILILEDASASYALP